MNRITVSVVSSLVLATLPLVAIPTGASAQERVVVGDLDLSTSDGLKAFDRRSELAAIHHCRGELDLTLDRACRAAVKEEIVEKLPPVQRSDLAASSARPHQRTGF